MNILLSIEDIINRGNGIPENMVGIESRRRCANLLIFLAVFLSEAFPAPGQAVRNGPVEARLVAEKTSTRPGSGISIAVLLSIDEGWHVYWKNPGDSGLPTTIDWDLPPGFRAGPIQWPVPERFVSEGLVTYGYTGQVVLMTEVTPPERLQAVTLLKVHARAGWLACRLECTPGSAELDLSLPVKSVTPLPDSRWSHLFEVARSLLPRQGETGTFSAAADTRQVTLEKTGVSLPNGTSALFYPDAVGQIRVSSPQAATDDGGDL